MLKVKNIALKSKLPALVIGLSLLVASTLQIFHFVSDRNRTTADLAVDSMEFLHSRRADVERWLDNQETHLRVMASNPIVTEALQSFSDAWAEIPGDPTSVLQSTFITNSPYPQGQRHRLIDVQGPAAYSAAHVRFQPFIDNQRILFGHYDVFLIDPAGNVVYTTFKEADFATNLVDGPYAESGLGKLFASAMADAVGVPHTTNIEAYAPSNGVPAFFMGMQIKGGNGKPIGVVAVQLAIDELTRIVAADVDALGETGDVYLVDEGLRVLTGSRFEGRFRALDAIPDRPYLRAVMENGELALAKGEVLSGQPGYISGIAFDGPDGKWAIVTERDAAETIAPIRAAFFEGLMIVAAASLVIFVIGLVMARSVTTPLDAVRMRIAAIENGNLTDPVPETDRGDEIGEIAQSTDRLREKLSRVAELEQERIAAQESQHKVVEALRVGLQSLSAGNLTKTIDQSFDADYESLRRDFNATVERLESIIEQVVETSMSIRARSAEISQSSEDLSRRTENQAAALEETAAALDEMTASVKSAAEGAREVATIVQQARSEAEESGKVVRGAVDAMTEIEKSSEHISQIIGVIDDIAFQTSLLALNAGVEAARAGEAGRGFAVVASEVRALAQRSSAAAKEIKGLIGASAQHVDHGVDQVDKAGTALARIVERVAQISSHVSDIATGAREQSAGLGEINIGLTQLDQVTQQNSAMVEESTAASSALHLDATTLSDLVSRFETRGGRGHRKTNVVSIAKPRTPVEVAPLRDRTVAPASFASRREQKAVSDDSRGTWQEF